MYQAANFGKGYLDLYNPTDYIGMGKALRVLNAVRYYEIGIPISYSQYVYLSCQSLGCLRRDHRYHYLSPTHLISRLTSRNLHLLALRVSSYLNQPADNVLKHWAMAKILKSKPTTTETGKDAALGIDEDVAKSIVEKFETLGGGGVSYAEIAKKAWEVGRTGLATLVSWATALFLLS